MLSVQELPDATWVTAHRRLWDELWSRTSGHSFRESSEFVAAQSRMAGGRWRLFQVSVADRPVGLVPLIEQLTSGVFGSSRVLSAPESNWGFGTAAIGPHLVFALAATIRHLHQHDEHWDELRLPELADDARRAAHVPRAFAASELDCSTRSGCSRRELSLPVNWSQFWADRDAEARQQWRELDLPFWRQGDLQFVRFRPAGSRVGDTERNWKFLSLLDIILHQTQATEHGRFAAAIWDKLRDSHAITVDAGCADVCVLQVDSQPAAAAYNLRRNGQVETLLLIADPHVPDAADLLIGQMLRDEIARGDAVHAFLPNSTEASEVNWSMWQCRQRHQLVVTHHRQKGPSTQLRRWLNGFSGRITSVLRR